MVGLWVNMLQTLCYRPRVQIGVAGQDTTQTPTYCYFTQTYSDIERSDNH